MKYSEKGMPGEKSVGGNIHESGNSGDVSNLNKGSQQTSLDDGRPHGKTGTEHGLTTGRPSGKPANLFDK